MPRFGGSSGNFTTADHKFDAASIRGVFNQPVDESTGYSDTIWSQHRGSGSISMGVTIGGFCADNAASTNINADGMSAAGSATTTLTLNTSTTYAMTLVVGSIEFQHSRVSGYTPCVLSGMNAGTVTETWDETP